MKPRLFHPRTANDIWRQNTAVMRRVIALNASFFNAQRMVGQYVRNAYLSSSDAPEAEM